MARNNSRRRFFEPRTFRPVDAGEQAGFTRGRHRGSRTVDVCDIIMALVLLKEPPARKGVPANRDNPPAFRLDFVFNPTLVDEMHRDPNNQTQGKP